MTLNNREKLHEIPTITYLAYRLSRIPSMGRH